MLSVYFENVDEKIGSLYLEKALFVYGYEPMIFVCKDDFDNRYFCVCDDVIEQQSWIITRVTTDILKKILKREIKIMDAFNEREVLCVDLDYETDEYSYRWCSYSDIPEEELPVSNQYLLQNESTDAYLKCLEECFSFEYAMVSQISKQIADYLKQVKTKYVAVDLGYNVDYCYLEKASSKEEITIDYSLVNEKSVQRMVGPDVSDDLQKAA